MIKLKALGFSEYKPVFTDMNISSFVPLHRMQISKYIPKYNPEDIITRNSSLQLFLSFWIGNGFIDSNSLSIMINPVPSLSLFLLNETFLFLPSLFNKFTFLLSDSDSAIGITVQDLKEEAFESFNKLRNQKLIDNYLNDVFKFISPTKVNIPFESKIYKVESNKSGSVLEIGIGNALIKYLISQCLIMGTCTIPIRGYKEEEIKSKLWLYELTSIFDEVFIITSNQNQWQTQSLEVRNIKKEILNLTSEMV